MSALSPRPDLVGILVLAAGSSRRFGSDKRLARLPQSDRTLLQATLDAARASDLPTRVCLRAGDSALAAALSTAGIQTLICQRAHEGMGSTLAEGVSHMTGWQGAIIALADMPQVRTDTYRLLARHSSREKATLPVYRGQRGNPVCFGADWFSRLQRCSGECGARNLLASHPQAVHLLDVEDPGILRDVDHPADLEAMR